MQYKKVKKIEGDYEFESEDFNDSENNDKIDLSEPLVLVKKDKTEVMTTKQSLKK